MQADMLETLAENLSGRRGGGGTRGAEIKEDLRLESFSKCMASIIKVKKIMYKFISKNSKINVNYMINYDRLFSTSLRFYASSNYPHNVQAFSL